MKPRLTVACSLVALITVVIAAVQPTLVLGQPVGPSKVYLPLIRTLRPSGIPVFEQPERRTLYPEEATFYEITLKNTGTVIENFILQILQNDQSALAGVSASLVNQSNVFLSPQQNHIITVRVAASQSASFGMDTHILRATAESTGGLIFADVAITTVVSQRPTAPTQIQNGSFEAGPTEWTESSGTDEIPLIEETPNAHSGRWQASFLSGPDDEGHLSQDIFLTAEHQALSFWYKIESDDPQCEDAAGPSFIADYATFGAFAPTYPMGTEVSIGGYMPLCAETDTNGQWVQKVLDISRFEGYPVEISVGAINNQFGTSRFYIDDVELIAAP